MPARHEQIDERAGHEQAMSVLLEPAITYFDETKHSRGDPDRMLDPRLPARAAANLNSPRPWDQEFECAFLQR